MGKSELKDIMKKVDYMKSLDERFDTKYAIIESFKIDKEGHGILTMHFGVDYDDGYHQGVGGYGLDEVIKDSHGKFVRRTDDSQCFMDFLIWVYEEFECDDYADLQKDVVGKPCIVYFDKGEKGGTARGIKPFGKDNPMIFPDFMKKYFPDGDED